MAKKEANKPEDSMEDILHSIRDIVSGEETAPAPATIEEEEKMAKEAAQAQATAADEDVLELTQMIVEETPTAATITEPGPSQKAEEAKAPEPVAETPTPAAEPTLAPVSETTENSGDVLNQIDDALGSQPAPEQKPVAEQTAIAENKATVPAAVETKPEVKVAEANNKLVSEETAKAATESVKGLINSIPQPQIESPQFRSGTNVEQLVIEALKPMLSEWLNDNLPVIVKQVVEKEVKKLIPKD